MARKVILGQPYSGALYAYFSEQLEGNRSPARQDLVPYYYSMIYGGFRRNVDVALTFLLLYDEVHLAPAKTKLPQSANSSLPEGIYPELGLRVVMDGFPSTSFEDLDDNVKGFDEDPIIRKILFDMGMTSGRDWPFYLSLLDHELALSVQERSAIICSGPRQRLIDRMIELKQRPALQPSTVPTPLVSATESYLKFVTLTLAPTTLKELVALKNDKTLRLYADGLFDALKKVSTHPEEDHTAAMAGLMEDAMEFDQIARNARGIFGGASKLCKLVGAHVGSTGLVATGHALDVGKALAGRLSKQCLWWEYSEQVKRVLGQRDLIETVKAARRSKTSLLDSHGQR